MMKKLFGIFIFFISFSLASCLDFSSDDSDFVDLCPNDPQKVDPGVCGCGKEDIIDAISGIYSCVNQISVDLCPNDPDKAEPGFCGCGIVDIFNESGQALCLLADVDLCPDDAEKRTPGVCGCNVSDEIDPKTGIPKCLSSTIDLCPESEKRHPGICGCDEPDIIDPETGIPLCLSSSFDFCPQSEHKTKPGICGCDSLDIDSDGDTVMDCFDECLNNKEKLEPGICGCEEMDSPKNIEDSDGDGVANCLDACPDHINKSVDDSCACDQILVDFQESQLCASPIFRETDFIQLRDLWNKSGKEDDLPKIYALMNDLDLAEILSENDFKDWKGIGTLEHPFDGIFIGQGKEISLGKEKQNLVIKSESDYLGLFSVLNGAKIVDLNVWLNFSGKRHVGILAGYAEKSNFSQCKIRGELSGDSRVGGLAGAMLNSSADGVKVWSKIRIAQEEGGGLAGLIEDSTLNRVAASVELDAGSATKIGGLVGFSTAASRLFNAYAQATITGASQVGGLVGGIEESSAILNAFAVGQISSENGEAGGLVGTVSDFCRIKNVYTLNKLALNEKNQNSFGALIGAVQSDNNISQLMYYWNLSGSSKGIALLGDNIDSSQNFEYQSGGPILLVEQRESLLDTLNSNISCIDELCSLDGQALIKWTLSNIQMGEDIFEIPSLSFSPEE